MPPTAPIGRNPASNDNPRPLLVDITRMLRLVTGLHVGGEFRMIGSGGDMYGWVFSTSEDHAAASFKWVSAWGPVASNDYPDRESAAKEVTRVFHEQETCRSTPHAPSVCFVCCYAARVALTSGSATGEVPGGLLEGMWDLHAREEPTPPTPEALWRYVAAGWGWADVATS